MDKNRCYPYSEFLQRYSLFQGIQNFTDALRMRRGDQSFMSAREFLTALDADDPATRRNMLLRSKDSLMPAEKPAMENLSSDVDPAEGHPLSERARQLLKQEGMDEEAFSGINDNPELSPEEKRFLMEEFKANIGMELCRADDFNRHRPINVYPLYSPRVVQIDASNDPLPDGLPGLSESGIRRHLRSRKIPSAPRDKPEGVAVLIYNFPSKKTTSLGCTRILYSRYQSTAGPKLKGFVGVRPIEIVRPDSLKKKHLSKSEFEDLLLCRALCYANLIVEIGAEEFACEYLLGEDADANHGKRSVRHLNEAAEGMPGYSGFQQPDSSFVSVAEQRQ